MSADPTKQAFFTQQRSAGDNSDEEDDDAIYFNSQVNNLTFVSDEDEAASGKAGRSPVGSRRLPGRPDLSTDPNAVPVNYGTLPLAAQGPPVLALSPEALHTGLPLAASAASAGRPQVFNRPTNQVSDPGSFATFQVRDPDAETPLGTTGMTNVSSPQSLTTTPLEGNTYTSIVNPPTNAVQLEFRRYYEDDEELAAVATTKTAEELVEMESIPGFIRNEESAGIFMGQLPASYNECDIKLLLKSLARMSDFPIAYGDSAGASGKRKRYVEIRDVKCHARDKTCAFIMINASSLLPILDFSKRVLCDVHSVYVCSADKKNEINHFISRFPRDMLKGVPKAALVLEKLTPQGKNGSHGKNQAHQQAQPLPNMAAMHMPVGMPQDFAFGGSVMGGFIPSPMGGRMPNPAAPAFVPSSFMSVGVPPGAGAFGGGMPGGVFLGPGVAVAGQMGYVSQQQQQQQQQQQRLGMMGLGGFPTALGPSLPSPTFGGLRSTAPPFVGVNPAFPAGAANISFPGYLANNNSIASMEAANQALIAASRSRQNSFATNDANKNSSVHTATQDSGEDAHMSSPPPASFATQLHSARTINNEDGEGVPNMTQANTRAQPVSLPQTLEGLKCSCGFELAMSQVPDTPTDQEANTCEICKKTIDKNMVICYTCPETHIFICSLCGIKHMQRIREKQEKAAQQQSAKPKFTLVGLDNMALGGGSLQEGSSGDTPSATGAIDSRGGAS